VAKFDINWKSDKCTLYFSRRLLWLSCQQFITVPTYTFYFILSFFKAVKIHQEHGTRMCWKKIKSKFCNGKILAC